MFGQKKVEYLIIDSIDQYADTTIKIKNWF